MKNLVVGKVVFGEKSVDKGLLREIMKQTTELMDRHAWFCKNVCPDCGTSLITPPDFNSDGLKWELFYVPPLTWCPKCDRYEVCNKCGMNRKVHKPKKIKRSKSKQ
jgi:rRNA maturation protein Nop10